MLRATCAATAVLKDGLSPAKALRLAEHLAADLPAAAPRRELHVLLRRSDEPAWGAAEPLRREPNRTNEQYAAYQRAPAEVLELQAGRGEYHAVQPPRSSNHAACTRYPSCGVGCGRTLMPTRDDHVQRARPPAPRPSSSRYMKSTLGAGVHTAELPVWSTGTLLPLRRRRRAGGGVRSAECGEVYGVGLVTDVAVRVLALDWSEPGLTSVRPSRARTCRVLDQLPPRRFRRSIGQWFYQRSPVRVSRVDSAHDAPRTQPLCPRGTVALPLPARSAPGAGRSSTPRVRGTARTCGRHPRR